MYYVLPKEISSETKMTKNLYLFDFIFIGLVMIVAWILSSFVYENLRIIYYITCFVLATILRTKSKLNPGKRIFTSIYLMFVRDRKVYSRY